MIVCIYIIYTYIIIYYYVSLYIYIYIFFNTPCHCIKKCPKWLLRCCVHHSHTLRSVLLEVADIVYIYSLSPSNNINCPESYIYIVYIYIYILYMYTINTTYIYLYIYKIFRFRYHFSHLPFPRSHVVGPVLFQVAPGRCPQRGPRGGLAPGRRQPALRRHGRLVGGTLRGPQTQGHPRLGSCGAPRWQNGK